MDEEITITKNGRATAVIVSSDEFEGWKETVAIQSDCELMRAIRNGLRALQSKTLKPLMVDALLK